MYNFYVNIAKIQVGDCMSLLRKQRGFTLIETAIASVIITFVILGSVNLMISVYKGITANQLKTIALNMVSEQIDLIRQSGFEGAAVTDDACLPDPLSNLEAANCIDLYDSYQRITVGAQVFQIYKYTQYAIEDGSGNIIPKKSSETALRNLKQITVTVNYTSNNVLKTTSVSTLLSNREMPMGGSSVAGIIQVHPASGSDTGPGLGSGATVHFVGYPQYTTGIDDDAGRYTVENVMSGLYTLYAEGAGFSQTFYASNPLYVSPMATAITGVNFSCNKVVGSSVSGRIYIDTYFSPTITLTPTPTVPATNTPTIACGQTKTLKATGSMTGKTSTFSSSQNIKTDDGYDAWGNDNTERLYTEFDNYTQANTHICAVRLVSKIRTSYCGSLLVSVVNNSSSWANTAVPAVWTGNQDSARYTLPLTLTDFSYSVDITDLYTTWDWTKVNNLGVCYTTTDMRYWSWPRYWYSTAYIDIAFLQVDYDVNINTPTYTPTFTITPTPNMTATYTPICGNGARVIASDGLSQPYDVTSCDYIISNINPLLGSTDISATLNVGTDIYYASVTGVPVSAGTTTTNINLLLTKLTGQPALRGLVADDSNHSIFLSGVSVYLGTTNVATTGGGGAYAVVPVLPGTYTLSAAAPGYRLITTYDHTYTTTSGLWTAPTLYMMPSGSVSGLVTDFVTGQPVTGRIVNVKDGSGSIAASGTTDESGVFLISNIDVGSGYKIEVYVNTSNEDCITPGSHYYSPVSIVKGVTLLNQNFKIKQNYKKISGKVAIDGVDVKNGVTILALPSSVTITPSTFSMDSTSYPEYTGRSRILYPSYSLALERDGTFEISAPVNTSYNIYAYYSYVSYTGTAAAPVKTLLKYYKKLSNVTVGTSDVTGQNITGSLSSWTSY